MGAEILALKARLAESRPKPSTTENCSGDNLEEYMLKLQARRAHIVGQMQQVGIMPMREYELARALKLVDAEILALKARLAESRPKPSTTDSIPGEPKMEAMHGLQARKADTVHEMSQLGTRLTRKELLQLELDATSIEKQIRALEAELAKSRPKPSTTD